MRNYKVEIREIRTYVMDVRAENEPDAIDKANTRLNEEVANNTIHLFENRDPEFETHMVYDVTDTDDPFDA